MTSSSDIKLLSKFEKGKCSINQNDIVSVETMEKVGLLKIDRLYTNTFEGIPFKYATITEKGSLLLKRFWYLKYPFLKIFFK